MKYYWQISTLFLSLSIGMTLWIAVEMGLVSFSDVSAGEKPTTVETKPATPANPEEKGKVMDKREEELSQRERGLSDKEAFLTEQAKRYEKIIVELRTKLNDKDKDTQAKLSQKDVELKDLRSLKDKEIKDLRAQMQKQKDSRAEAYQTIYEKMEPKRAAKILDEMDIPLASKILGGMKEDKAAEILSAMTSERARLITERTMPGSKRNLANSNTDSSRVNDVPSQPK